MEQLVKLVIFDAHCSSTTMFSPSMSSSNMLYSVHLICDLMSITDNMKLRINYSGMRCSHETSAILPISAS